MLSIDRNILQLLHPLIQSKAGSLWAHIATRLGNGGLQAACAGLFLLATLFFRKRKMATCAAGILSSIAVSGVFTQLLKLGIGRARPGLMLNAWTFRPWVTGNNWHSFPSGHTATSFAIATVVTGFYPKLWWLYYGLAVFIGFGRIISESHFPSDVLAGAVLGSLCGLCLVLAVRKYLPPKW